METHTQVLLEAEAIQQNKEKHNLSEAEVSTLTQKIRREYAKFLVGQPKRPIPNPQRYGQFGKMKGQMKKYTFPALQG